MMIPRICRLACSFTDYKGKKFMRNFLCAELAIVAKKMFIVHLQTEGPADTITLICGISHTYLTIIHSALTYPSWWSKCS